MAPRHSIRPLNKGSVSAEATDQVADDRDYATAAGSGAAQESLIDLDDPLIDGASEGKSVLPAAIAIICVAGWTAFYAWAMRLELAGAITQPEIITRLITEWAVPVLLVGVVWLIAMRNSRAEASRFAASAALLRRESATLEERLKIINRELSLAREFLSSQSQELESIGRIAAERISAHANELQTLIQHNGQEVSAIATTSQTALSNMNLLRDNLPVVANSAKDAANQIGNAGRASQEQVAKLVAAFERLNQFGKASDAQVQSLGENVATTLGSFEEQLTRIETLAGQRLTQVQKEAEVFRLQLDELETQSLSAFGERIEAVEKQAATLAGMLKQADDDVRERAKQSLAELHREITENQRRLEEAGLQSEGAAEKRLARLNREIEELGERIEARGRQFDEHIEQRQASFETHEAQASEVLAQRLAELDDALAQRRQSQIAETEKLVNQGAAITAQLEQLSEMIAQIRETTGDAKSGLAEGLGVIGEQFEAKRQTLSETERQLATLTDAGVRLLEIIQSGARFAENDLANNLALANDKLSNARTAANVVHDLMLKSSEHGSQLDKYLIQTREHVASTDTAIRELEADFAAQNEDTLARLQGLRGGFMQLAKESGALAETSQQQLREALSEIEQAITASINTLDETARSKLTVVAESLGGEAVSALERALRNETAATIGKLEQSAAHASGVGREAVVQLRDQLVMVNELTGNLEQRVARARELAEEQINNDFARRMALITDSLNSAAIDITAALSADVPDTAWEAYLKGDRGIFTRRAVRLIDTATAREIAEMYQNDDAFKANVSRYIHDFEAMLRSILSTRNGNVLSVTMLGSDMGKLYVTLAQSIQRFRT